VRKDNNTLDSVPVENNTDANTIDATTKVESVTVSKKKTDYILYLSYRLNQLNEENKEDRKTNFNIVVQEWKDIKNNKLELAKKMEVVKKWHNM
jgi:hypothetical protein